MQPEEFEKLLHQPESDYIDFKADIYNFSSTDKDVRCEFVKDVICMWNTPREGNAYIVFGVAKHTNGSFDLCGISKAIDDNDFQQQLDKKVNPKPDIRYEPIHNYQGKNFGVLVIPVNKHLGACRPQENCKGMQKDKLYFRLGSMNSGVTDDKRIQWILNWFDDKGSVNFDSSQEFESWDRFCDSMENFSSDYYYLLVVSKFTSNLRDLKLVGLVDWLFVVDFDENSDSDGLLSKCRKNLEERKTLHLVVKDDSPTIHVNHGCYWYFANGMVGKDATLIKATSDDKLWKTWQRSYLSDIEKQIKTLADAISKSKPLKVLCIVDDPDFDLDIIRKLEKVFERIDGKFTDNFSSTVICPVQNSALEKVASDYNAEFLTFPLDQLLNGFLQFVPNTSTGEDYALPSRSGTPVTLPLKRLLWLQEELEIVHLKSGLGENAKNVSSLDYLKGQEISWENLRFHHDAERNITDKLQKKITESLNKGSTRRVNFYHVPGSGGTTVAKKIVWELHETYPCLILRSCKNPKETVARLSVIAELCDKPLLLMIDSGLISNRESDALYNELAASHLSIVILIVLRTFEKRSDKKDFFLEEILAKKESDDFYNRLVSVKSDKEKQLDKALKEKDVTPFSLSLLAFDNDYRGIDNYVISRLAELKTEKQKNVVIFLAIAYYYGQEKIAAQWFHQLLDIPPSKAVTSEHLKGLPAFSQLMIEDSGFWRMAHQVFAERCLRLLLPTNMTSGDSQITENELKKFVGSEEWKYSLSDWAKDFATFCREKLPSVCDATKSLIYKVFYNRENSEILGSESAGKNRFAKLVEDLPSKESKLGVLRHLADLYGEEAHVWAHLGRFYSVEMKEFDKAIEFIDKALQISDQDFLIHHMKGMAICSKAYELMNKKGDHLTKIVELSCQASDSFTEARRINYENEYGYISEVQMIIKVLDYTGKSSGDSNAINYITRNDTPSWLRESLEKAFDLLSQVRQLRRGSQISEHEQKCQARLDTICGSFSDAVQKWNNLLSKKSLNSSELSSIRRSLVWTYLHSVNRNWQELEPRTVQRIAELLEENLKSDSGNDRNLRLWLQAIRYLDRPPTLEDVIEKVAQWKQKNDSLESLYYLYTLYCLQGLEGSSLGADKAKQLMKECQERSRFQRKNEFSVEWLGKGEGFKRLLHESRLGECNRDNRIWEDTSQLMEVQGIIDSITSEAAGYIVLKGGLKAFFVPGRLYFKGKDENRKVECFIGFSYSGLRAWGVKSTD